MYFPAATARPRFRQLFRLSGYTTAGSRVSVRSRRPAVNIVSATQGEDNLRKEFFGLVVQGSQLSH